LREIGLAEHTELFRAEKIDPAVLPSLSDADLRELGLPLGDRKKLRAAIDALSDAPRSGAAMVPGPLRAAPPRAAAEQRHLTVMFCDIVDSTRLAATFDLEILQRVVDNFQHHVARCVARYDGFVAKFMGDGILVYFGYPQAHEDDAERAIRAGLDIVDGMPSVLVDDSDELTCRIGIASGVVVVGDSIAVGAAAEKSVLGETPNFAARLQAAAPRNGVIVAASTRALVANLFDLSAIEPLALKGFDAGVTAWQVIAARDEASRFHATRRPRRCVRETRCRGVRRGVRRHRVRGWSRRTVAEAEIWDRRAPPEASSERSRLAGRVAPREPSRGCSSRRCSRNRKPSAG
jgi:class 3 adenylate cyclase